MSQVRTVFEQIVAKEAIEEVRAAAASGLMPIPPHEAAAVLSALLEDPAASVREQAAAFASRQPLELARDLARDRRSTGALVHHLVIGHGDDRLLINLALNHPNLTAETLQLLIYKGDSGTLRTIATLTPKLRANPHLIEVMLHQRGLPAESREQLHFLAESLARKEAPVKPEEPEGEPGEEQLEEAGRASVPPEVHEEMTAEGEVDSDKKTGWFERILAMKVSEKIYWAMKGNKEVRMNLVRDANKMVSLSVMKSPRLTLAEVEMISNSTNVSVDVLRSIANNREWVSKYPVQSSLARNPKTPSGITLRYLPRLQKRDLQQIVASKGMAEVVRSTAAKLLKGKGP